MSWQTATDNCFHVAPLSGLRDTDSERYELTDHLGNVRVTVGRTKAEDNTAETVSHSDYYPFGMSFQRLVGSPKYRYGFQGQFAEYDEDESGLHHFQLRAYDSRIGRWTTPDPYNQYWSPYVGMGNAPNMIYDPTGGWGYGTSLLITAGAAAAGYGIDRAFGGDGSTGLAIGLFAGAAVGHAGLGEDWTINLPEINWSGLGKAGKLAARYVPPITTLARNLNVLPDMRLPTSEIRSVPEPRARPVLNSPVGDAPITSPFGVDRTVGTSPHIGTDYGVPTGTPVQATASGTVARSYQSGTYGNTIIIDHGLAAEGGGNVYTLYAHGDSRLVQAGDHVNMGDAVLTSGNTGRSTNPHLHYEIIRTDLSPHSRAFFRGIDIRFSPEELGGLLGR